MLLARWAGRQVRDYQDPILSAEAAQQQFGIDGHLTFDQPIAQRHARELQELKQAELLRQDIQRRAQGGVLEGAATLGAGFLASAADPIGLAASFIPVVGQSRYALALAKAGGAWGRAGVRLGYGALEGAAMLEPMVYGLTQQEQADYGAADSMLNIAFGTVLGGGLHAGIGRIGDGVAAARGMAPGYEHTVDAEVGRRLSGDMTQPDPYVRDALAAFGADDTSGLERALAAAQPDTRETLLRAAVAIADGRPVAVKELARMDPALRGEMLDDLELWRPGRPWPDDVNAGLARAAAISETFADSSPDRKAKRQEWADALYRPAPRQEREAYIVLGLPASGKSTLADRLAQRHGARIIDPDHAKEMIPEFSGGIGADAVHRESIDVFDRVVMRAIGAGDNIVVPRVGRDVAPMREAVQNLKALGYRVHLRLVELPTEKAVRRNIRRFRETGRLVSPEYVKSVGAAPRTIYDALKGEVDSHARYDNDVPRGHPARHAEGVDDFGGGEDGAGGPRGRGGDGGDAEGRGGANEGRGQAAHPALGRRPRHGAGFSLHRPQPVYDADGTRHMVRYELVEASSLIASHGDDLRENPAFPAALQPRDRARAAAESQINDIVANFEPERLGHSSDAATGAPIIGPDDVVESGNGRVLSIRRVLAANGEDARRYRAHLAELGFNPRSRREPVLVRRRLDDLPEDRRRAFTVAAQKVSTLELSATERAMAEAPLLDSILHLLDGGDVTLRRNDHFVKAFIAKLPQAEQGRRV